MLIEQNVLVSPFTTFKTGGPARFFARVRTIEDVLEVQKFAKEKGLTVFPLGSGSNVLFPDSFVDAFIVKDEIIGRKIHQENDEGLLLTVGSGESWDDLVKYTVERGWFGLENLSWIPGTVGAAPVQNIGAYGVEVAEAIHSVDAVNVESGKQKTFSNEECQFSYRDSIFKKEPWFITAVTFQLAKKGRVNIGYKDLKEFFKERYSSSVSPVELRDAVVSIRKNKLPDVSTVGTAGSFFKNPIIREEHYKKLSEQFPGMPFFTDKENKVKIPLAWILDKVLGLRGYREGQVGLFETQPLALVNYGGATTRDILEFANKISDLVRDKTGIEIEKEVVVFGGKM